MSDTGPMSLDQIISDATNASFRDSPQFTADEVQVVIDALRRAERRVSRAMTALSAQQTVEGVTDRGWLSPDEWVLDKVGEALSDDGPEDGD